jgi:hypothetical protein
MLFPRNALTSGPQACFFAQKGAVKVKVGKEENLVDFRMGMGYKE